MFKLFRLPALYFFFFFNDTATTEIYTLSLHDALPICGHEGRYRQRRQRHQRVEAGLQQDASGSHHDRTVGNRGWRRCCVKQLNRQTNWSKKWLKCKARLFNVLALWWTSSSPATQCPRCSMP